MGWSCNVDAGRTLDALSELCRESTNTSNTWKSRGSTYFYDVGRENRDGAITGSIWRSFSETHCRRAGTFRIEPDGTVARGPAILKQAYRGLEGRL